MQLKKFAANSKPHYQGACQWCCCFIQEHRGKWRRKLAEKVWFALPFLHLTLFSWLLFLEHAGELRINILRRIFFLASYVLYFLYIGTLSTAVLLANHGFQKKPLRCCKTNMLRLDRCTLGIFTQLTGFRGFYSSVPDVTPATDSNPKLPWNSSLYVFILYILQKMRQQAHETGRAAAIPITVRQLEAIIRLSESLAKMRL